MRIRQGPSLGLSASGKGKGQVFYPWVGIRKGFEPLRDEIGGDPNPKRSPSQDHLRAPPNADQLVPFDAVLAQRASDRSVKIITAIGNGELLPRSFNDFTQIECKFCSWKDRCWDIRPNERAA